MSKSKVQAPPSKGAAKQDAKKKGAFNAKSYERPGLLEQEILEIKDAFDLFDNDQSGNIDVKELRGTMTAHGLALANHRIMDILDKVDVDGNGQIDFDEFLSIMSSRLDDSEKSIENVFRVFDGSGEGKISVEDLQRIADELGDKPLPEDLQDMINFAQDGEKKDFVSFEEFTKICKQKV